MLPKKRNNNLLEMRSIRHLIPIALLMVRTGVFLKIDIPATEEFFQRVEDFLIFLHELDIKSRLHFYPSLARREIFGIPHIHGKTAFAINQTDNVICCKHIIEWIPSSPEATTTIQLTSDAAPAP